MLLTSDLITQAPISALAGIVAWTWANLSPSHLFISMSVAFERAFIIYESEPFSAFLSFSGFPCLITNWEQLESKLSVPLIPISKKVIMRYDLGLLKWSKGQYNSLLTWFRVYDTITDRKERDGLCKQSCWTIVKAKVSATIIWLYRL